MKVVLAVLLAAAALLAAGCGSSSNDAADTTVAAATTTEQADTSTDTSSSADTSTEDTDADTDTESTSTTGTISDDMADAAGLSEGCKKVANLSIEFSNAIAQASSGSSDDLETTAKAFENFANQVPEEIRDDFKVIAAAFAKYVQVIKNLDLTPGQTPDAGDIAKLTKAAQELDDASVKAANESVTKWASDNCSTNP